MPGRCRSTRLCDYCAKLEAVEISELLALDAMGGRAPEVYAVLTSSRVSTDPAEWYEHRRKVLKALKRRWPDVEYCCITEFTTGRAQTSGGKRRPHFNLLLKGIPAAEAEEASALIKRVWCERLGDDAEPWAQYAAPVQHEGGLLRYLALHFLKESQRPPKWWHGHRVTRSRGYLDLPSWKARAAAKASLRLKRALRVALSEGHTPEEALAVAELAIQRAAESRWECVQIEVDRASGELLAIRPMLGGGVAGPERRRPLSQAGRGPSRQELEQGREFAGPVERPQARELSAGAASSRGQTVIPLVHTGDPPRHRKRPRALARVGAAGIEGRLAGVHHRLADASEARGAQDGP